MKQRVSMSVILSGAKDLQFAGTPTAPRVSDQRKRTNSSRRRRLCLGWPAQAALCPPCETLLPDKRAAATYSNLYSLYRDVYFSLGNPASPAARLGHILPRLREIAADARALESE